MTRSGMIELKAAESESDYQIAKELFLEYASQLPIDLSFQNFTKEVETIKTEYGPPLGTIVLVYDEDHAPIGCFAIRKFEESICELKRMYLRSEMQGRGFGSMMLNKSIETARQLGYKTMRLDTLPTMTSAINLYKKTGFYEIPPYRYNPVEGTKYVEIQLDAQPGQQNTNEHAITKATQT